MKNSFVRGIVSVAALSALAACGGTGTSNNNGGGNTPGCTLPSTFVVSYPINGATNVPSNTGYVYIASQQTNLANGNFNTAVQPPNGLPAYIGGKFVTVPLSQVPKPRTLATFTNPIYYKSLIAYNGGGLISGATYQVGFNNLATSCSPVLFDTFTTQ